MHCCPLTWHYRGCQGHLLPECKHGHRQHMRIDEQRGWTTASKVHGPGIPRLGHSRARLLPGRLHVNLLQKDTTSLERGRV